MSEAALVLSRAKLAKKFADKIYKAKIAYYTSANPIMTDWEYDCLEKQLSGVCPNHPILAMVGYDMEGTKKLSMADTIKLLEKKDESQNQETT